MTETSFDSIRTAVMANRLDAIVREMTNTLLRTARSAVINSARDFSCAIATADNELLACAEGLPVHIFGTHLQAAAMSSVHPDLREGDAYLDNNPYVGNSHAADHTILVPVFVDGEHMFTAVAKAHQADIGNAAPTTYDAVARDVYEEGALIFPVTRIQRDYEDVEDVIRMARLRIRVSEQWYGDYLAALGSARVAERRLKEFCTKYGVDEVKTFIRDWFDYSERTMRSRIQDLPSATLHGDGHHDAFDPFLPDGLDFAFDLTVDGDAGTIDVDLTGNAPNVDCGLNLTEATTNAVVFAGIFNALGNEIPKNSGAFRCVTVRMDDGAAIGRPRYPHSCSLATTNLADRLLRAVGLTFSQLGSPHGIAEGAAGMGPGFAVVSGQDVRTGKDFVNQICVQGNGGAGSAFADGWVTCGLPVNGGLMYRDSVEIDEIKMPLRYDHMRVLPDSAGPGRFRGGPSLDIQYGPVAAPMMVIYPQDGEETPARGANGGHDGKLNEGWLIEPDGSEHRLPANTRVLLKPGQSVRGIDGSGGGYGDPAQRDPERVLRDVRKGWETVRRAHDVYRVVVDLQEDDYVVDHIATKALREAQ